MTKAEDIGPYQIVKEIGRGAMGVVYHGRHKLTHKDVALKVVFENVAASFSGAERFRREVKISSIVQDAGIVEVFDAQEHEGKFWYAMELLEGEDLEERFDTLDRKELLSIIEDVLETLAKCHEKGIVHRDLKPENIYIVPIEGGYQTKILDFGIASIQASPTATQTGYALGTPAYMSPEQAMNPKAAGPASDVWSVGVMLYRMVHRKLPFEADSPTAVMMKVVNEELPPMPEQLPNQLRSVIETCMRKKPEDRFSNAATLLEALRLTPTDTGLNFPGVAGEDSFVTLGSGDTTVDPAPPESVEEVPDAEGPPKRRMWVAAGVLGLIALGLLVALGAAISSDSAHDLEEEPTLVTTESSEESTAKAEPVVDESSEVSEELRQLASARARSNSSVYSARQSAIEASRLEGEELRGKVNNSRSGPSETQEKKTPKQNEQPPEIAEKGDEAPTTDPSNEASSPEEAGRAEGTESASPESTDVVDTGQNAPDDPESSKKPEATAPTQPRRPPSIKVDEPSQKKTSDEPRPEKEKTKEKPAEKKDPDTEPDFFTF